MAKFSFDVGGKKAKGESFKIQGAFGSTFRATGNCPFCKKPFKAGFNPGDRKSQGDAESQIRAVIRRHHKDVHGG